MTRAELGRVAIREDPGRPPILYGLAAPVGVATRSGATVEYPGMAETFGRGAWARAIADLAGRRVPILDRHEGNVVAMATVVEADDGLRFDDAQLLDTLAAREYAATVAAGADGLSVEFLPGRIRRSGRVVQHVEIEALAAIAGTYKPAYRGTAVALREDGSVTMETTELDELATRMSALEAREIPTDLVTVGMLRAELETLRRSLAEAGAIGGGSDPFAPFRGLRSLGALMAAAVEQAEIRGYASRALADQLTTDSNEGVLTPGVLSTVYGIVSRGRPAITAFGGPRALGGSGMTVDWPYFDGTLTALVGAQAVEKTEITSAKVEIKKGSEAIQTFAGGSDLAYQLIRRSAPSYLEIYGRIILAAYAVVTDAAFVTELETGTVTQDFAEALAAVDATEMKNHVIDASITVETATGSPAEFVLASTTAFTAVAKLFTPVTSQPAQAAAGVTDIRNLAVNIGNLPVIHVPSITAGKLIVSNREAAGWFEDGPFQASEEDVAKLGRNVAYWGLGVPARFIPGGVVEVYDVSP